MLKHANTRSALRRQHNQGGFSVVELVAVTVVVLILASIAIPKVVSVARNLRSGGDARDLSGQVATAKMRAAADFTQARVRADLTAQTFHLELWNKPVAPATAGSWVTEGGTQALSPGVTFGFATLSNPPSGTQAALGQASACLNDIGALPGTGAPIANTACIVFNSRGVPVDSTGAPTANGAIYITDGNSVYAITVSSTALIQTWSADLHAGTWWKR